MAYSPLSSYAVSHYSHWVVDVCSWLDILFYLDISYYGMLLLLISCISRHRLSSLGYMYLFTRLWL